MGKRGLIFDIGMHRGEDSEFYLKKGFDVVGVEANPSLIAEIRHRFAADLQSGRLRLIDRAISPRAGMVDFFVNPYNAEWSTISPSWADRNARRGAPSRQIQVPSTTLEELLAEHGVPYYMKIDVEGADLDCLVALRRANIAPRHISVESSATSIETTFAQLAVLEELGYRRVKIVPQHKVDQQRCPSPAREGTYVDHHFQPTSSGLFGEEAPGTWMSLAQLKRRYRRYYSASRFISPHHGVFGRVSNPRIKAVLRQVFAAGHGWYDTHATF